MLVDKNIQLEHTSIVESSRHAEQLQKLEGEIERLRQVLRGIGVEAYSNLSGTTTSDDDHMGIF